MWLANKLTGGWVMVGADAASNDTEVSLDVTHQHGVRYTGSWHSSDVIMGAMVSQITSHRIMIYFFYIRDTCIYFVHKIPIMTSYTYIVVHVVVSNVYQYSSIAITIVDRLSNAMSCRDTLYTGASLHNCISWWRHQLETFPLNWPFVRGIHRSPGEFPSQRPVTQSFDVFFDLPLNKRLSKQSWDWWFETPSRPLWRHCNVRHQYGSHRVFADKLIYALNVYLWVWFVPSVLS